MRVGILWLHEKDELALQMASKMREIGGEDLILEGVLPLLRPLTKTPEEGFFHHLYPYLCQGEKLHLMYFKAAVWDYIETHRPDVFLFSATDLGRSVAAMTAARFETGLTADCTGLGIQDEKLVQIRPAYGGNVYAEIITPHTRPQLATIRPNIFKIGEKAAFSMRVHEPKILKEDLSFQVLSQERAEKVFDLKEANVIILAGGAVDKAEKLDKIKALAQHFGASWAVTRKPVQMGLAPYERQVGVSGQILSPQVALLLGVSGTTQTMTGLFGAQKIIAVNQDEQAPVFEYAHIKIVGDCFELIAQWMKGENENGEN